MKKMITLLAFLIPCFLNGQDSQAFRKQVFVSDTGSYMNYRLLKPHHVSSRQKYPLVIFLHGAGERGDDNGLQLKHGSNLFLNEENRKRFPAYVVFPQCPEERTWSNFDRWDGDIKLLPDPGNQMMLLFALVEMLKENLPIDEDRIYLSGLSLGGYGTFDAIMRRPELFAAALPICGGADTSKAAGIAHIPVWIFHGDSDPVVSVELSRNIYKALQSAGSKVRYSEYEGVGHDSWTNAFAEKEFLSWMFSQRKEGP